MPGETLGTPRPRLPPPKGEGVTDRQQTCSRVADKAPFQASRRQAPSPASKGSDPGSPRSVTARTRHFESWQHFVRDAYENLVITVHLIDTHSMIADILTKAMPKVLDYYKKFRDIIMDVVC